MDEGRDCGRGGEGGTRRMEGVEGEWRSRPHETLNFLLLSAGKLTIFIPGVGSSPDAHFSSPSLFPRSQGRRNFSLSTTQ